jgi:hypothetical protein
MRELNLPEPVAAYFEADRRDADAVARCFTADGLVVDEGRSHAGRVAIAAWKQSASARFSYTSEPFALQMKDRKHIVKSRITGDFPGSPVDLRYIFTLRRGKIARLEITP